MRARHVPDLRELLDPEGRGWTTGRAAGRAERVALMAAPVGLQPSGYLRAKWSRRAYGATDAVHVACAHDGERIAFHLRWSCATESLAGGEAFPDAAAVALPVRGDPALALMGAEEAPIHILHWQAGQDTIRSVLASGIGTSRAGPRTETRSRAIWKEGVWRVVIARRLEAADEGARLRPGSGTRVGFAIWKGANQERGGIKAFSLDWTPLELEAVGTGATSTPARRPG